jgi:glycerophosphoryl diester phosphodiesterase
MKKNILLFFVSFGLVALTLIGRQVFAEASYPIYRVYNPTTQEHFYTANNAERKALIKSGWGRDGGIAWYAPEVGAPVYRLYHKTLNDHYYTANWHEVTDLQNSHGWHYEGIVWYSSEEKTVPIYHAFSPKLKTGGNYYTSSKSELTNLVKKQGWKDEQIAWYGVKPPGIYIAHRGNTKVAPENSLSAFAQLSSYAGAETDIQLTTDHKWRVFHDNILERVTNGKGLLSQKSSRELDALRIKGPHVEGGSTDSLVIPSVREYLLELKMQNKLGFLELKQWPDSVKATPEDYQTLSELIRDFGDEERIHVISFSLEMLQGLRAVNKTVAMSYLVNDINTVTISQARSLGGNTGLDVFYKSLTRSKIDSVHHLGLKVSAYTVPSDDFQKMTGMGVDFVTTDD